jgi:hypothetical protein
MGDEIDSKEIDDRKISTFRVFSRSDESSCDQNRNQKAFLKHKYCTPFLKMRNCWRTEHFAGGRLIEDQKHHDEEFRIQLVITQISTSRVTDAHTQSLSG